MRLFPFRFYRCNIFNVITEVCNRNGTYYISHFSSWTFAFFVAEINFRNLFYCNVKYITIIWQCELQSILTGRRAPPSTRHTERMIHARLDSAKQQTMPQITCIPAILEMIFPQMLQMHFVHECNFSSTMHRYITYEYIIWSKCCLSITPSMYIYLYSILQHNMVCCLHDGSWW